MNEIYVQFVIAKARVASLKRAIPRLQQLPCVLGSRFSKYFVKEKSLGEIQTFYWTDSTTVLSCIKKMNDHWSTLVGNRVKYFFFSHNYKLTTICVRYIKSLSFAYR